MARILFVVHELLPGGTETHVLTLAVALLKKGHHVGVFTSGGSFQKSFRKEKLKVHLSPEFETSTKYARSRLFHVLSKYNYDVIHVHDVPGYRLLSSVQVPAKIVMTLHGLYQVRQVAYNLAVKADAVIAVSGRVKQEFHRKFGRLKTPFYVIPNGIDTERFQPKVEAVRHLLGIAEDAFVVGYAGRFTLDKRRMSKCISKALLAYAQRNEKISVLIAGRASNRVFTDPLPPRVTVLGSYGHMELFYQACDVVVGTGRVALEAMMCEIPTIAVGSAGNFGRIRSSNYKRVVFANFADHGTPARVNTKRLLAAIRFIRRHRNLAIKDVASVRRRLLRRFSMDQVLPQIERIYGV